MSEREIPDFPLSPADQRYLAAKDEWRHGRSDLGAASRKPNDDSDPVIRAINRLFTERAARRSAAARRRFSWASRILRRCSPLLVRGAAFSTAHLLLPLTIVYLLLQHPDARGTDFRDQL